MGKLSLSQSKLSLTDVLSVELAGAAQVRLQQQKGKLLASDRDALEQLSSAHTAMMNAVKTDFNIDCVRSIREPAWRQKERKDEWLLPNNLDTYISKEAARGTHLARNLVPLMEGAPEGPIVDIGTRSGFFPYALQMHREPLEGRHIEGLDVRQDLPTAGDPDSDFRHGPNPLVREYDGKHMPYADHSVAIVTLNDVLHHVEPPSRDPRADSPKMQAFLNEVKRVLKPGGVLLMTEDFMGKTKAERQAGNPYAQTVLAIDEIFHPGAPGSQRSQEEWAELLTCAGFTVERTKHIAGYNVMGFPMVELVIKARAPA